ncbi:hypothetical protein AHiyo8_64790 [Arthrobacter sp. Hiyo8]|nr:hypothetical protein AHiyo8_64790 [Arthrobacter sp. Hiyo8]
MAPRLPPAQQQDFPAQELYAPSPQFTWAELQSMATDGVLTPLYEKSFTPSGSMSRLGSEPARPPWWFRIAFAGRSSRGA